MNPGSTIRSILEDVQFFSALLLFFVLMGGSVWLFFEVKKEHAAYDASHFESSGYIEQIKTTIIDNAFGSHTEYSLIIDGKAYTLAADLEEDLLFKGQFVEFEGYENQIEEITFEK